MDKKNDFTIKAHFYETHIFSFLATALADAWSVASLYFTSQRFIIKCVANEKKFQ